MSIVPGAFVELLNLPEEIQPEWAAWYDENVLKTRAQIPGVYFSRRTTGLIGSVQNLVVYDLSNFTLPYSKEWAEADQAIALDNPAPPAVAEALEGMRQVAYRQIFSMEDGPYEPLDTAVLHCATFEVPSLYQDEFNDWYNTEHVEFVKTVDGYLNCRRYQGVEDIHKFIALYDVVELANSEAKDVHPNNFTPWAVRARAKLPTFRERRVFGVQQRIRGTR